MTVREAIDAFRLPLTQSEVVDALLAKLKGRVDYYVDIAKANNTFANRERAAAETSFYLDCLMIAGEEE
jgi:hypothetical protein